MKILISTIFVLFLTFSCFAQSDRPQANEWRGMRLDESAAADVLQKFGAPVSDKIGARFYVIKSKWLTSALKNKKWRVIHYENIDDFKDIKFIFDETDKLRIIHLEPKGLTAQAFSGAYEADMKPYFSGIDEAAAPRDFERNQGKVYAKTYPSLYYIGGKNDKAYVFGEIGNSGFGSILKQASGTRDGEGNYPGKVLIVQLISRRLENRDNVDMLK